MRCVDSYTECRFLHQNLFALLVPVIDVASPSALALNSDVATTRKFRTRTTVAAWIITFRQRKRYELDSPSEMQMWLNKL